MVDYDAPGAGPTLPDAGKLSAAGELTVDGLHHAGVIHDIDRALVEMLHRRLGGIDPWVGVAVALVSRAAADGDVCIDLDALARQGYQAPDSQLRIMPPLTLDRWLEILNKSPAIGVENEKKPVILDGNRIYLQRYWKYEKQVALGILNRCGSPLPPPGAPPKHGPHDGDRRDDDQQRAIHTALAASFVVVSGGPGTGKTFTIAGIIQALIDKNSAQAPRIKLAAPTGKAAARLQESLEQAFAGLQDRGGPGALGAFEAQTIHRLLGVVKGRPRFRHHAGNPLPADVVIVDEASMVDLALMARLMEALAPDTRLILVGDKDQLASVEAGAVLGDICWGADGGRGTPEIHGVSRFPVSGNAANGSGNLAGRIVILKKSYRFHTEGGIDLLGRAINAGDGDKTLDLLRGSNSPDVRIRSFDNHGDMASALERLVMEKIAPAFGCRAPMEALERLSALKILTPLRKGPVGVESLNRRVEQILARNAVIAPLRENTQDWYAGRPIMITANDYHHNLFNGDVGITSGAQDGGAGGRRVVFRNPDQTLKSLMPEQLPAHETVYAMTVHKSQGTEFNEVLLVFPFADVPLLTRELIYTAVTRARRRVEIWADAELLKKAVGRRIRRTSGLRQMLWPQASSMT